MSENFIDIKNANISYPSTVYRHTTFKQEIFRILKWEQKRSLVEDVHALKNITIRVNEGEKVGVIGRNGSGKTTLLKSIAGLYPLQSGILEVRGKIRSMFELNIGFEPEATGRENITYRGLLLGETPKTMKEKEEEIVAFAELGDFIDYPLKAYSSGMIVRLAFAISTAIRGNILLLDETLAAGDAAFQQKVRERMRNVIDDAKILMMVSHDMNSIRVICDRVIYLKAGEVVADGPTDDVIQLYLKATGTQLNAPGVQFPKV